MLLLTIAASLLAISNSIGDVEKLGPHLETILSSIENVGTYHTDAFSRLADLYSQEERRPNSRSDLQRDVNDIVISYCSSSSSSSSSSSLISTEEEEQLCVSHAQRVVDAEFRLSEQQQQQQQQGAGRPRSMTIPDDMDPELQEFITEMHDIMDTQSGDTMVLEELMSDLQKRVRGYQHDNGDDNNNNNNTNNYYYKIAVLSGVAVALESCRMWHDVYSDMDHSLYGLHFGDGSFYQQLQLHERRRLQNPYEGLRPEQIARVDVVAAISTLVNYLLDSLADFNTFLLIVAIVIPISAAGSIAASAAHIINYDKPVSDAPTVSSVPSVAATNMPSVMGG